MIRFFISYLLWVFFSSCVSTKKAEQVLGISNGRLERHHFAKSKYLSPRNVDVWLPDNYQKGKKYQVLYMHDGQMLFDSTTTWNGQEWCVDEIMGELTKNGQIEPAIVVAIWNAGAARHSEYFPQKPFEHLRPVFRDSLLENGKRAGYPLFALKVYSDNYLRFLVEELKPFIDKRYNTLADAQHTFIAGSSMGGLISWYALCEYPKVFGGAACLSTHWPGFFDQGPNPIPDVFVEYLREDLPAPGHNRFYFDHGTATLDAGYEVTQIRVGRIFKEKGYSPDQWASLKFEGAEHSERAWRKRLHTPVTFLLQKQRANH